MIRWWLFLLMSSPGVQSISIDSDDADSIVAFSSDESECAESIILPSSPCDSPADGLPHDPLFNCSGYDDLHEDYDLDLAEVQKACATQRPMRGRRSQAVKDALALDLPCDGDVACKPPISRKRTRVESGGLDAVELRAATSLRQEFAPNPLARGLETVLAQVFESDDTPYDETTFKLITDMLHPNTTCRHASITSLAAKYEIPEVDVQEHVRRAAALISILDRYVQQRVENHTIRHTNTERILNYIDLACGDETPMPLRVTHVEQPVSKKRKITADIRLPQSDEMDQNDAPNDQQLAATSEAIRGFMKKGAGVNLNTTTSSRQQKVYQSQNGYGILFTLVGIDGCVGITGQCSTRMNIIERSTTECILQACTNSSCATHVANDAEECIRMAFGDKHGSNIRSEAGMATRRGPG